MSISPISCSNYQKACSNQLNNKPSFKGAAKVTQTFVKNPQIIKNFIPVAIAAGALGAYALLQPKKSEGAGLVYGTESWCGYDTKVIRFADGGLKLRTLKDGTKLQEFTDKNVMIYDTQHWNSRTVPTIMTFKDDGTPIRRTDMEDGKLLQEWNDAGELIYDYRAKDPYNPPKIFTDTGYGKHRANTPISTYRSLEELEAEDAKLHEIEERFKRGPSEAELKYEQDLKKYNESSWSERIGKKMPKPSDYGLVRSFCDTPIAE